jgi:hypothetical protein
MRWFKCLSKEEREVLQNQVAGAREAKRKALQESLNVYKEYEVCGARAISDTEVEVSATGNYSWERTHPYSLDEFLKEYEPKLLARLQYLAKINKAEIDALKKDLDTAANGEKDVAEAVLLKYKKQTLVYTNIGCGIYYGSPDGEQKAVTKKPRKGKKK